MTSEEEDSKQLTGWAAIGRVDLFISAMSGLGVMFIVNHFAGLGRGRAAGLCALVDIIVVKLRWEFRGKPGFWCAILLILLGQIAVVVHISFGDQWMSAYALLPIALVVYVVDECIVFLFARGFGTRPK